MLEEIIGLDKQYYMNTFGDRLPVAFESGEGIKLYSTSYPLPMPSVTEIYSDTSEDLACGSV